MLINLNIPEGPLLMFASAVVIVAVMFLFLAGVFALAEMAATLFEKRLIVPGIFCWYLSCCTVFLLNLVIVWAFLWLVRLSERKEAEAFFKSIVDLPFYLGVPAGLLAIAALTLLYYRLFDYLAVRKFWRSVLSALSSVTLTFAIYGLLHFVKGFDFFGIIGLILRVLATNVGFILFCGLMAAGLFVLTYFRLTRHAQFVIAVNTRV